MKKIFTLVLSVCLVAIGNSQNVAINTDNSVANVSALLDVKSTTKGMLIPRMTSTQRTAIVSPANGLMVYDITTNSFWFFNGLAWVNITNSGSGSFTLPFDGTANIAGIAFRVANSGNAIEGASTSGNGVYANSETGAGVNALSGSGYGIIANSAANSSIYAFSNNAQPTINAINSHTTGVGIKGNSSNSFGIWGTTGGVGAAGVKGEATNTSSAGVRGTSTNATGVGVDAQNASGGLALNVNGNVKIAGGNTSPANGAVLTSDATGNATWKNNKIAFNAENLAVGQGTISSDIEKAIHFGTESYDYGNNYTLLTGAPVAGSSTFTVPKTGVYNINASLNFYLESVVDNFITGQCWIIIKRGANTIRVSSDGFLIINYTQASVAEGGIIRDLKLFAGDLVWIQAAQRNSGGSVAEMRGGHFSAHLVFED